MKPLAVTGCFEACRNATSFNWVVNDGLKNTEYRNRPPGIHSGNQFIGNVEIESPMSHPVITKTARTRIRKLHEDDAGFILKLVNSPGWLRYIGDRNVHSVIDAVEFLRDAFIRCYEDHGFGYYLVESVDSEPIGICGFLKKPYLDHEDFGFALLPEFQGSGYALEASKAVLSFGEAEFGFTELVAVTDPENESSKRLLKKLDFHPAGQITTPSEGKLLDLYRRIVNNS